MGKTPDLKESCLQAAREVIALHGIAALSMRDISRALAVSHQAPYRHFSSRDHLLAEIMRRCFVDFAAHLDQFENKHDVEANLAFMGNAYLDYAHAKPLEYQLMFATPWPEPALHRELVQEAAKAFNLLRDCMRRKHRLIESKDSQADLDALFIWSTLHGMASITQANVMPHLNLDSDIHQTFKDDVMQKIGYALNASKPCNQ